MITKPTKPDHFIGKTRTIATVLFRKADELRASEDPVEHSLLFTGPPGTGKSTLAQALAAQLAAHKLAVEKINGQSCTIDVVRRWQADGHYLPLYGKCRVQIVDEIDAASTAAANELRTYLDDLSAGTVFIATTNKPITGLQEQLQSRFKVYYFERVKPDLITSWLVDTFGLPHAEAATRAHGCDGNVRAAKADALSYLDKLVLAS